MPPRLALPQSLRRLLNPRFFRIVSLALLGLGLQGHGQAPAAARGPAAVPDAKQSAPAAQEKQAAPPSPVPAPSPATPAEPFNRVWKLEELLPDIDDLGTGREFRKAGRVYQDAGCGICHAFSTYFQGNGMAPDLTGVGTKYSRDFILQSIIEPSASINGQYYATLFKLKSGRSIQGTVVDFVDGKYKVAPAMAALDSTVLIPADDVVSEGPSPVSPMPPGLMNPFTREQIMDLLAFLDSKGNPDAAVFQKETEEPAK